MDNQSGRTLNDIIECLGAGNPDKVALFHDDGAISYSQLARRTRQVSNGLGGLGIARQSRIALLSRNDPRYFELLFGCGAAGMALAVLNWRLKPTEMHYILADCQAEVVFVSAEFAGIVENLAAQLPQIRHIIILDSGERDKADYDSWRDRQASNSGGNPVSDDDDLLQIYTSGTTGNPKGARLTCRNVMSFLEICAQGKFLGRFDDESIMLAALPYFHIAGTLTALHALYNGSAAAVVTDASPPAILGAFRRYRITKAGFVPAIISAVLDHPDTGSVDFQALDMINYGGAPIAPPLLKRAIRAFGCEFLQMFGMTETCAAGTMLLPKDHDPESARLASVGRRIPGIELRIVDHEGRDVEQGCPGEVLLKGDSVMKGYWGQPEQTAKAIVDGWYHSGDVAFEDEQGYVFVCDRLKDMIISGGENIYSAEVEKILAEHDSIADVAVIGVPDEKWGETVKAIVVAKPDSMIDEAEVIAFARERLAHYKCPQLVEFVSLLPRNAGGKILKRELRGMHAIQSGA